MTDADSLMTDTYGRRITDVSVIRESASVIDYVYIIYD